MITSTCPYLGLKEDPATALNFSSEGNCCHRVSPAVPVERPHQMNYCLVAQHVRCPVFVKDEKALLPLDAVSPTHRIVLLGRMFWGIIPVMLMLIGMVAAASWTSRSTPPTSLPEQRKGIEKVAGGLSVGPALPVTGSDPTATPFSASAGFGPTTVCNPPAGWVVYTVQPTDSIFLLSLVYGVSVEDLQQANCLGQSTIIRPGELFNVPLQTTSTPTQTATATARPRVRMATSAPAPGLADSADPAAVVDTAPIDSGITVEPTNSPEDNRGHGNRGNDEDDNNDNDDKKDNDDNNDHDDDDDDHDDDDNDDDEGDD